MNNTLGAATVLRNLGNNLVGTDREDTLTITAGDNDYYKFTTTGVGTVANAVTLNFSHASGDLSLQLLDAGGTLLASSATSNDRESVSLSGRAAGTYVMRVFGATGSATNSYSLTVDAPTAGAPPTNQDAWTIFVYMTASNLQSVLV